MSEALVMRHEILAGEGWRRVELLKSHRIFVLTSGEIPNSGFSWHSLFNSGRTELLGPALSMMRIICPSVVMPDTQEILYADDSGLKLINWSNSKDYRFLDLDLDSNDVDGIWVSPETGIIYFVLWKRLESASLERELTLKAGVRTITRINWDGESVFALEPGSKKPRKIAELDQPARFAGNNDALSCLYFRTRDNAIWKMDLATGKSSPIARPEMSILHMSITPRGRILVWGSGGEKHGGIDLYETGGKWMRRISDFGHYAQISKDERQIAFLTGESVWLVSSQGGPCERVLRLEVPPIFTHTGQIGSWCECGRYLAISVYRGKTTLDANERSKNLFIGDVVAKEFVIHDLEARDYLWEPCVSGAMLVADNP